MDAACPLSPRAKDFSITSLMTGPSGLDPMQEGADTTTPPTSTTTSATTSSTNNDNSINGDSSPNSRNSIININNNNNNITKDLASIEPASHRLESIAGFGVGAAGSLGGLVGSESLSSVLGHCIASGVQTSGQECVFNPWSHQVSHYNQLSSMQACVTGCGTGTGRRYQTLQYEHPLHQAGEHHLGTATGMAGHVGHQQHHSHDTNNTSSNSN
ncbi:hypothetical protein EGW08_018313, partial [Elysia chlorotica]